MGIKLSGCCGFGPNRKHYFSQLKLVEVQQSFFHPPSKKALSQWRQAAPADFVFTVRAWQLITHGPHRGQYPRLRKNFTKIDISECGLFRPNQAVQQAYQATLDAALALDAPAILFETPLDFTPTATNRRNMSSFFESIDRQERLMAWDPQGLWSGTEVHAICEDLGLLGCVDPIGPNSEPPGEQAYLRLKAPRYSDDDLILIAETLGISHVVYCLWNNVNMFKDAQRLQAML